MICSAPRPLSSIIGRTDVFGSPCVRHAASMAMLIGLSALLSGAVNRKYCTRDAAAPRMDSPEDEPTTSRSPPSFSSWTTTIFRFRSKCGQFVRAGGLLPRALAPFSGSSVPEWVSTRERRAAHPALSSRYRRPPILEANVRAGPRLQEHIDEVVWRDDGKKLRRSTGFWDFGSVQSHGLAYARPPSSRDNASTRAAWEHGPESCQCPARGPNAR